MAYSKNTWKDGDIITAAKINNIEEGLNNIDDKAVTSITVGETQYLPTGGSVQIPAYPSKVSDLKNDRGFITLNDISIPSKTSDLQNDSGFITSADLPEPPTIPTKISDLENDSNFITSAALEGLVKSGDLETLITSLGYVKESRVQELINEALANQSANKPEV